MREDLGGQKFDRLNVLFLCREKTKQGGGIHVCQCKCGKIVFTASGDLKKGTTRSCGCRGREMTVKRKTTHGRSHSVEYRTWLNIRSRCNDPNQKNYKYYGGRGIRVCNRWEKSFIDFFKDMGEKPSKKHSIDRINHEGDYSPENCRWTLPVVQANNKRNNVFLEHEGKSMTLPQWSRETGLPDYVIWGRIKKGWSTKEALTTTVKEGRQKTSIKMEHQGETKTLAEWSRHVGISKRTLYDRIFTRGWGTEKALETPIDKSKQRFKKKEIL